MLSKEILRKKFSLIRKKKYFEVKENFFSPISKIISSDFILFKDLGFGRPFKSFETTQSMGIIILQLFYFINIVDVC